MITKTDTENQREKKRQKLPIKPQRSEENIVSGINPKI